MLPATERVKRLIRLIDRNSLSVFVAEEEDKQYLSPVSMGSAHPLTRKGVVFAPFNDFGVNARRAICQTVDELTERELLTVVNSYGTSSSNRAHELIVKDYTRKMHTLKDAGRAVEPTRQLYGGC